MLPEKCLELMDLAENLKHTLRHSWISDGRQESVAEHCWRLAMLALCAAEEMPGIDCEKLLKMCLLHDMGEAFTGDIPAFVKTDAHRETEKQAVADWLCTLSEPTKSEWTALFAEMDAMQSPEAKLTVALDKMETLIQHNEADIATWIPREYTDNLAYGQEAVQCADYTVRLKALIDAETRRKIASAKADTQAKA